MVVSAPTALPPLAQAIEDCDRKLDLSDSVSKTALLDILYPRDRVRDTLVEQSASTQEARQLMELDRRLEKRVAKSKQAVDLSDYRRSLLMSADRWWWQITPRRAKSDLFWRAATGALLILTALMALNTLKQLLVGAPDKYSYLGTALLGALSGIVGTGEGRTIALGLVDRWIPRLRDQYRDEAKFAIVALVALLVFGLLQVGLPLLASSYHNNLRIVNADSGSDPQATAVVTASGADLKHDIDSLQRIAALDPNAAVPCFTLASVYEELGRLDQAASWYGQALDRDPAFMDGYIGQGRMFILRRDYGSATAVLMAGLRRTAVVSDAPELSSYRYRLLSHLGWAYYASGDYPTARRVLEEAVALETSQPDKLTFNPAAHYFLAQTLDALKQFDLACDQWGVSWSDDTGLGSWYQVGWGITIKQQQQRCAEGKP